MDMIRTLQLVALALGVKSSVMQENTTSRRKQNGQSPLCVLVACACAIISITGIL